MLRKIKSVLVAAALAAAASLFAVSAVHGQIVIPPGAPAVATTPTIATINSGTVLQVSGAVSPDGRYVGLAVNPSLSSLDGFDTFIIPNTGTIAGVAGIQQAIGIKPIAFRPAQIGKVICVDNDPALLAARVGPLKMMGTSLKTAVRTLADTSKENIVLGIRGLEQAGVDLNEPHDFVIPAGSVKESLLAIIKIGASEPNMVVTAEDKVISVATQAQADNTMITKTYYLQDLLANLPRMVAGGTDLYSLDVTPTDLSKPPAPVSFDKKGKAILPRPPVGVTHNAKTGRDSTNILEVITATVRPEIWKNHGGKAEISLVGDRVTIKAPQSVHALIDGPKTYNPNKIPLYVNYSQ